MQHKNTRTVLLIVISFLSLIFLANCSSSSQKEIEQTESEEYKVEAEDESEQEDLETAAEEVTEDSQETLVVNVDYLRLRSGPSTDHEILDRLMKGDLLKLIEIEDEWVKVITADGKEGWVHGDYVLVEKLAVTAKDTIRGNSVGNIINHGLAAIQDEWIYYINDFHDHRIYKIGIDGSNRTQVNDDYSRGLNVIGDWIYYVSSGDVFKIRSDGSERTQITREIPTTHFVSVVGDWVYYTVNPGSKVHRIRTDGSERTKLNDQDSTYMNVVDGWIYYYGRSGSMGSYTESGIYKLKIDGSEQHLISYDSPWQLHVVDDWIYFCNWNDDHRVYRINSDGSNRTQISDISADAINVAGNFVYYSHFGNAPQKGIYRAETDGGNPIKIVDDAVWHFCVVGDWVHYYNRDDDGKIYRIRTDGTERQPVY